MMTMSNGGQGHLFGGVERRQSPGVERPGRGDEWRNDDGKAVAMMANDDSKGMVVERQRPLAMTVERGQAIMDRH
jgi:hypothetical protein